MRKYFFSLALATFALSFVLVLLGGTVHNTGASLACPDWPLCFGQVLPPMKGLVAIEHSHRLLASFVGFLCILLLISACGKNSKGHRDAKLIKFSVLALCLVIFQGLLGGLTVLLKLPPIVSTLHLATSQMFLGVLLYLIHQSRSQKPHIVGAAPPKKLKKQLSVVVGLVYLQIIIGAAVRHSGAGVACGLGASSSLLCLDPITQQLTFWPSVAPAQLHMIHRIMALVVGVVCIAGTLPTLIWAKARGLKSLKLFCVATHAIWFTQFMLGVLTVTLFIGLVPVTLHLVFAVILWLTVLTINFRIRELQQ